MVPMNCCYNIESCAGTPYGKIVLVPPYGKTVVVPPCSMLLSPGQTPWTDPRGRQRSENPAPGETRMCESPGGGQGGGWSGLELTDT